MAQSLPAIVPFDLGVVEETKMELAHLLSPYLGQQLIGETLTAVLDLLAVRLGAGADVIRGSITDFLGHTVSVVTGNRIAWRLAGNLECLQQGQPISPRPQGGSWLPAAFLSATKHSWKRTGAGAQGRVHGACLTFKYIAGPPAGESGKLWLYSHELIALRTDFGFSAARSRDKHKARTPYRPYVDPRQLAGMRFYAWIDPCQRHAEAEKRAAVSGNNRARKPAARLQHRQPASGDRPAIAHHDNPFFHIRIPDSLREYNQALLELRDPRGRTCPGNFSWPCHLCPAGQVSCQLATHERDHVAGHCPGCDREAWFHDQPREGDLCIECCGSSSGPIKLRVI